MLFALRGGFASGLSRQEQAVRFYREAFGFEVAFEDENWLELSSGAMRLTLYKGASSDIASLQGQALEAGTFSDNAALDSAPERWRRDPFGFAFRWSLSRDRALPEISCNQMPSLGV
jgi:catechol 2,3-dioxygenase-like lactoylglutathione lyase family enzyme